MAKSFSVALTVAPLSPVPALAAVGPVSLVEPAPPPLSSPPHAGSASSRAHPMVTASDLVMRVRIRGPLSLANRRPVRNVWIGSRPDAPPEDVPLRHSSGRAFGPDVSGGGTRGLRY